MQAIPVKKFEKISTEVKNSRQLVVYKITDYKDGSITYEVQDSEKKNLFKSLKEAKDHIQQIAGNPASRYSEMKL